MPSDCFIFLILLSISSLRIWNLRGGEGIIPQNEKLCQTILELLNKSLGNWVGILSPFKSSGNEQYLESLAEIQAFLLCKFLILIH